MDFYIDLRGTKAGPYSLENLKEKGYWKPERLVCRQGDSEWIRIADIREEDLRAIPDDLSATHDRKPEPPEKLSREAGRIMVLIFPLFILAMLYQKKAEFYYRQGDYELAEKYSQKVHDCVVVSIGLVCVLLTGLLFFFKMKNFA